MSRNNKNARLMAQARENSKRRQARRATGARMEPGRAAAPAHGKKHAWWQRDITYEEFIKGGAKNKKGAKKDKKPVDGSLGDLEINAELV